MSIDPKILSQLQRDEAATPRRERPPLFNAAWTPGSEHADNKTMTLREWGKELPQLTGSPAQIKWASQIRHEALSLVWPDTTFQQLVHVVASVWWIGNKSIISTMKFKEPAPGQMEGGQAQPELPVKPPYSQGPRESEFGPTLVESARANEAHLWAHSVSQNPKLAEAAILAVLAKLYKEPEIKKSLKAKAEAVLNAAEAATGKDAEAIFRMLRST